MLSLAAKGQIAQFSGAPIPPSLFIPAANNVQTNWQNAGLLSQGGIPTRNTTCSTYTPLGSLQDDSVALNSAISGCTAGQVVLVNGRALKGYSSSGLTAGANGSTGSANVTLTGGACPTPAIASGATVYDSTALASVGTYSSCTTGVITLTGNASHAVATNDVLVAFTNGVPILIGKGVTVRGVGACSNVSSPYCPSSIAQNNGVISWASATTTCGNSSSATVPCSTDPLVAIQPAAASNVFDFGWSGSLGHCAIIHSAIGCGTQLSADTAQGTTVIPVRSTTGFTIGGAVLIDEASGAQFINDPVGPNLYGQVWAAPDFLSTSSSPATGRVQWSKYGNGTFGDMNLSQFPYLNPPIVQNLFDRPTSEIHLVTSIGAGPCPSNCTITIDTPTTIAFRVSGMGTFTGTISGTSLTTTGDPCTLQVAQIVDDGSGVVIDGTYVVTVNSCSGGVGSYTMNQTQSVSARSMIFGAHQAHVYSSAHVGGTAMAFLTGAGIEQLSLINANNGAINFQFTTYSWTLNVECVGWVGGCVNINYANRNQIEGVFSNHCGQSTNNGAEYPFGLQNAASENLVWNSISVLCGKGMVGKTGNGNVVAYNYVDDAFYDYFSAIGNWLPDMGVNGSHFAATAFTLFEGNLGYNCDNDDTHGNNVYLMYFRNQCTGLRKPFTDPAMVANGQGAHASENDSTGTGWQTTASFPPGTANTPGPLRGIGPSAHDYWHAYVSNVIGSSQTTTGNGWVYGPTTFFVGKSMWMSGWQPDASHVTIVDPNLTTNSPLFLFKNGNYDFVNASIVDNASGFAHTFPNSMFLSSAPAFFSAGASCTYPYPWVTPTAGSPVQAASGAGSCNTYSALPAKARMDAATPMVQP